MVNRLGPINMLIVEDNPGDAVLFQAFFRHDHRPTRFHMVSDGELALDFLRQRGQYASAVRPDVIVLDINIPKIDGKNLVRIIKSDADLKSIPVIIFTSSESEEDVAKCYENGASCVLIKAADVDQAARTFELIESFWVNTVRLPQGLSI